MMFSLIPQPSSSPKLPPTTSSRDFVRFLLQTDKRPTAAQALHHEWIESFAKEHFQIPEELKRGQPQPKHQDQLTVVTRDRPLEKGSICGGLLLGLSKMSPLVFDDLKRGFEEMDGDGDG